MATSVRWWNKLSVQLSAALIAQAALLIGATLITLNNMARWERFSDYRETVEQMDVIARALIQQSGNYFLNAPRDYESYNRDLNLYNKDLNDHLGRYRALMEELKQFHQRNAIPPVLTQSFAQSNQAWQQLSALLEQRLGSDKNEPRLEYAAQTITTEKAQFLSIAHGLRDTLDAMAMNSMHTVDRINQVALVAAAGLLMVLLWLLHRSLLKPINHTVKALHRFSAGELEAKLPAFESNEIGLLSDSFNTLSDRMQAVFTVSRGVVQADNIDQALKTVFEASQGVIPIDWLGLFEAGADTQQYTLTRVFHRTQGTLKEGQLLDFSNPLLENALDNREVTDISKQLAHCENHDNCDVFGGLCKEGLQSAVVLSLGTKLADNQVIIFASKQPHAYSQEHHGLMHLITDQVTQSYMKTVVMESLVVSAVEGLAKLAESRDPETGDHLVRMAKYSAILAQQLGEGSDYAHAINSGYVRNILRFAPMHDIGKVGIEDRILLKPGKLTDEEREEMQLHPVIGANVLRRSELEMNRVGRSIFKLGIEIAEGHHEKFDGSGYPYGLKGQEIPLSARIVALADVFDALTSKRPYKEAWPIEKAMELIHREAGKHFDPVLVSALNDATPQILEVYEAHKHV